MDKRTKLLFLSMFVSVYAMASDTSVKNSDGVEIWYDFDSSTKTASVTYQGDSYDSYTEYSGDIVIPSTVTYGGEEYSVTSIGEWTFAYCYSLTSITIPEGVINIEDHAFAYCITLTSVTLPNSVTEIGENAFMDCYKLTNITIPESLTSIPDYAFQNCYALINTTIPEGVTQIGSYAFRWCSGLTGITLPKSLKHIGSYAFDGCSKLHEVYNKSDLNIIAGNWDNGGVAAYAKNVYTGEGENNLKTTEDYIFYVDGEDIKLVAYTGSETEITLPSDYEGKNYNIGDQAFKECDIITSVTIPEGVTSIGVSAFDNCSNLTSITLPNSVTSIGDFAFSYAYNLTKIQVADGNLKYSSSEDGVLFNKDKTALIQFPRGKDATGYTIPESVDTIDQHAFIYYSETQTPITIPEGVTTIGHEAFFDSFFTKIEIPATVTEIDGRAFIYCSYLTGIYVAADNEKYTSIDGVLFNNDKDTLIAYPAGKDATSYTIPDGVTAIVGGDVFANCDYLTNITLPESLMSIPDYTFSYAYNLTKIQVADGNLKYSSSEDGVLFNKDKTALIHFPRGKDVTGYTIPESVDTIYQRAFLWYNLTQTPITIPEGVTTIGHEAFFDSFFTKIEIPATVTEIGYRAFNCCDYLTGIYVAADNEKYTSIDGVLFNNDKDTLIAYPAGKDASSYTIPSSVKYVNGNAFEECYNLKSVYVLAETPPQLEWLSIPENITFYVSSESVEKYKSAELWKDYADKIQGINLSVISSEDDWNAFIDNGYFEALSGATINLKANISLLSEYGEVTLGSGVTLNGNGHTITLNGSSLFSSIGIGATVKNLVVTNTGEYANEKEDNFGIFACENNGTIESCAVETSNAQLVTNASTVGLLVGRNSGNINNCYVFLGTDAKITINNGRATAAGLVGKMDSGALKNCYVYCYDGSSIVDSEGKLFKVCPAVGSVTGDYTANNLYYCYTNAENLAEGDTLDVATKIQPLTPEGTFLNLDFTNPLKWEAKSQNSGVWPGTPVLTYTGIEGEYIEKDGENIFAAEVNEAADMEDLATLLSLRPDVFEGAVISLTEDIDYATADSAALDTLKRIGTAETPFNGTFDGGGHVIKNLKVNSDSDGSGAFFGVIGKDAEVKNLHFENVEVRVNEIKDEYIENDTIYLGIFADKLEGTLTNVSFIGNMLIEEELTNDKEVKLCFTSEGTDSAFIDHAFVYILDKQEEQLPDSNKACIVIKQHIGIGRRAKRTRKTCSNRRTRKVLTIDPDKDLSDEETADINSEYREFTDEEFMSGEVAYWLNYAGKGYTGEYIGDWMQGELYPIYQEDNANMLVKIVYTIEGNDDISFTAPTYANVGSDITMTYDEMPLSIKVDNLDISTASIGASETSITVPSTIEPIVNVVMSYYETSINDIYEGDIRVTSCDSQIKVEGAEGEMVRIVSLRGIEVMSRRAESDNMTIHMPQSGVYIVTVGDKSFKVACR